MDTSTPQLTSPPNGDNSSPPLDPAGRHPKAYVREAYPHEMPDVIACLTRAFAKNPAMNWYGSVARLVTDVDADDAQTKRTLRNLSYFQNTTAQATAVSKGVITVVVVPAEDIQGGEKGITGMGKSGGKTKTKADGKKKEHVIATALWLPPGRTLAMGPIFLIRAGVHNLIRGWGLTGLKVRGNYASVRTTL